MNRAIRSAGQSLVIFTVGFFIFGLGHLCYQALEEMQNSKVRTDLPMLVPGLNAPTKYPPVIRLYDSGSHTFFCTGAVISANYAVTAGHCLAGRSRRTPTIEVRSTEGVVIRQLATAAFYEERSDQGIILGDFSDFNQFAFTVSPALLLQVFTNQEVTLVSCGYPYGGDLFCATFSQRSTSYFGIIGMGYLYPGMSGGPVFEPTQMVLLGINADAMERGVYISPLIELLNHAKIKVAQ